MSYNNSYNQNIGNTAPAVSDSQNSMLCNPSYMAPQNSVPYNPGYMSPQDQSTVNRKYQESAMELDVFARKEYIKTNEAAKRNIDRAYLKEITAEKNRSIYEAIDVSPDGAIIVQTRNSAIDAPPRFIANMTRPRLTQYIRMENHAESAYRLQFTASEAEHSVYLTDNKISSGTYLLKKLRGCGVNIYKHKEAEQKKIAVDLIAYLIARGIETELIPDDDGWVYLPDTSDSAKGTYKFYKEEDLTWKTLMNLTK